MLQQRQGGFQDQDAHRSPRSRAIKWREVFIKAQELFTNGEYEQALVWYHRGRRLKPKAREFIIGITKCEQAIENRCPVAMHTLAPRSAHTGRIQAVLKSAKSSHMTSQDGHNKQEELDRDIHHVVSLNKDKKYLKGLLNELQPDTLDGDTRASKTDPMAPKWRSVKTLVESSLHYLDTRSTFWKQQMPLHALERLRTRPTTHVTSDTHQHQQPFGEDGAAFMGLLKEMVKCNQEFIDQQYSRCIPRCENCVKLLMKMRSSEVENKYEMVSNLYSVMGNAYFELGDYEEALKSYTKDMDIARGKDLKDARSRALENMGRVYARVGEFDTAICVWKEKAELCEEDRECAWLYHEIGYCYLSKKDYFLAQQFADMSGKAALAADDIHWRLNATILAAQVQAKMKNYEDALESFRVAHIFATDLSDEDELNAISDAINSLEKAIQSRRNGNQMQPEVFLTEYFEEEKGEHISPTPVPSNTLRHERVHDEKRDSEAVHIEGHNETAVGHLRRKDTLTPLQFQSQGLETSHYSKGQNNLPMKPPLPEEIGPDLTSDVHDLPTVTDSNHIKGIKAGRNRKLYNTPQLHQSTQSTALDLREHIADDPSVMQPNKTVSTLNNYGSYKSRHPNGNTAANITGLKQDNINGNRFSNKFSELRVRHRQERLPEEAQPDKEEQIPLTSESIKNMESSYRGRSSKSYVWKPKDKMNVSQFPWKSARQNKSTQGGDNSKKTDVDMDYATSARRGKKKNNMQSTPDKTGINYSTDEDVGKEVNTAGMNATDQTGSKKMLPKRVSKTPRSSQSDGNLLTKKSPVRQGVPRSQTVRASDTSAGLGKGKPPPGNYQSVSLQRIDVYHHSNSTSSGMAPYNVNKATGIEANQKANNNKNLNKHKSGSQSLPMLHYQLNKEHRYDASRTSRMETDRNSAYSDHSQDLKLPDLPGREHHISRNSGKGVINMEAYQKPLPKAEGVHIPKNILPAKKPKAANEKKSDMDLLKMLLDM